MKPSLDVDRLVRLYKALGDGTRLRLFSLLAGLEPDRALCVNALVAQLEVSQPAVSQHLAVLRSADLVVGERRGCHVHYRLNPGGLEAYREQASALFGQSFVGSPACAPTSCGRPPSGAPCHSKEKH